MDFKLLLALGLIVLLLFMIIIWTIKTFATFLGARSANYWRSTLAIVASFVVTSLLCLIIFNHFDKWWLSLFFIVLIPSYAVSQVFRLALARSFFVMFGSLLVSAVLGYVLLLVFIFSGLFSGLGVGLVSHVSMANVLSMPQKINNYVQLTRLQLEGHQVCRCIDNTQCFYGSMAKFNHGAASINLQQATFREQQLLQQLRQTVYDCYLTFQNIESRAEVWESADLERDLTDHHLKSQLQYEYLEVPVAALGAYQDRIMVLKLTNGRLVQGRLLRMKIGHLLFREFTELGFKEKSLLLRQIDSAQVLQ